MDRVESQCLPPPRARVALWLAAAACLSLPAAPAALAQPAPKAGTSRLPQVDLIMLAPPRADLSGPMSRFQPRGAPLDATTLNLGLRWQPPPLAGHHLNAQVWRRISPMLPGEGGPLPPTPLYGARLEMALSSPKRLSLRDLLGVQLDNGARLSVSPKTDKITIYYRMQF